MRFFVGASDKSPGQKAVQAMLLTISNPSYESGKHMLDSQDRHTMTALNLGSCFELVTCIITWCRARAMYHSPLSDTRFREFCEPCSHYASSGLPATSALLVCETFTNPPRILRSPY